jgi:hypothetical protein
MVDLDKLLETEGPERVEAALHLWLDNPLSQYFLQRLVEGQQRIVNDVFSSNGKDLSREIGEHLGLNQLSLEIEEVRQKIKQLKEKD